MSPGGRQRSSFYRRRLPHWQPDGAVLFLTYRLAGSLPKAVIEGLKEKRKRLSEAPLRRGEDESARAVRISKTLFGLLDRALADELRQSPDVGSKSPRWLAHHKVAGLIRENLHYWSGVRYVLHRYVIMPNHVHLLLEPMAMNDDEAGERWEIGQIMQGLKGYTARKANCILGRRGTFWQDESFDRWVRDDREHERLVQYIDMNPVAAGLCKKPQEWRWGSVGEGEIAG